MGLDDVVIPALMKTLQGITGTTEGTVRSVRYGEQLSVGQAPECWVLNISASFPAKQGSDFEQSDWQVELRLFYPYGVDQTQPENVLSKLIEPMRQLFRSHLHMGTTPPTPQNPYIPYIARARVMSATWLWSLVNNVPYRVVSLRLAVTEKSVVQFQA